MMVRVWGGWTMDGAILIERDTERDNVRITVEQIPSRGSVTATIDLPEVAAFAIAHALLRLDRTNGTS